MPKIENREQLVALAATLRERIQEKRATRTKILIGMGTCGIAAGAREVADAVRSELKRRDIPADVVPVGCIGICQMEPLVDIEEPGLARVTYQNVQPEMVSRLITEHLVERRVVTEWAVGRLDPGGIAPPSGTEPANGAERPSEAATHTKEAGQ
jgi:NADP-reducing hydrogenase subunit HndB